MAESRITVFTFAEGLLSALAHDLAIEVTDASGAGEPGAGDDSSGSARLAVVIAGLRVAGAMKRGQAQPLSSADSREIERRLRDDVFGGRKVIDIDATASEGRARLRISWQGGGGDATCGLRIERNAGVVVARGECTLSLAGIGLRAVKGPLGTFRLSDRVLVRFETVFG